jgi:hypothetical protein
MDSVALALLASATGAPPDESERRLVDEYVAEHVVARP